MHQQYACVRSKIRIGRNELAHETLIGKKPLREGGPGHDPFAGCAHRSRRGRASRRRRADRLDRHAAGEVGGFAPPGDIHRIRNVGDESAISLHVYGTDITRVGSSARRFYN